MAQSQAKTRISKKSKRPDNRPARERYWREKRLEARKVRNLMKYCGLSKQSAYKRWRDERGGRRMKTSFKARLVA